MEGNLDDGGGDESVREVRAHRDVEKVGAGAILATNRVDELLQDVLVHLKNHHDFSKTN